MNDTVVTYQGQQVSVPKEVADFLERDRRRMWAQYKRDQRHLNMGRISVLRGDDLVSEYTRLCATLGALVREVR